MSINIDREIRAEFEDLALLEAVVQRMTGRDAEQIRSVTLDEDRKYFEMKTGKRLAISRNFPFIGRGCIMGDRSKTREEIDQLLDEVLE